MDDKAYASTKRKLRKAYSGIDAKYKDTVSNWIDDAAILKGRMAEMRDTSREYSALNGQYIQIRKQLDRMLFSATQDQKDDALLDYLNE